MKDKLFFISLLILMAIGFIGCSEDAPLPEPEEEIELPADRNCSIYCTITGKITKDENTGYNVLGVEEVDINKCLVVVPDTIDWLPLDATVTVKYLLTVERPDQWINGILYMFPDFVKVDFILHEAPTSTDTE